MVPVDAEDGRRRTRSSVGGGGGLVPVDAEGGGAAAPPPSGRKNLVPVVPVIRPGDEVYGVYQKKDSGLLEFWRGEVMEGLEEVKYIDGDIGPLKVCVHC